MATQRAIVTGALGFIGRPLVDELIAQGIDTIAVDILPDPGQHMCDYVATDVSVPGALESFLSQDTVIYHLAARANVARSVEDPQGDFTNTLYGLFSILESAREYGCQVIFPSTASIFDPSNALPLRERSYSRPSSPYGAAKLAGEAYCSAYHRSYGLNVKIARMFNVYGPGMRRFIIHDVVRKIQQNPVELEILGDGSQIRDYLYIQDAVRGLIHIAQHGRAGEDYNLASGKQVRIIDLAREIARLMGFPNIHLRMTGASWAGDIPQWYADISKCMAIGFEASTSLDEGLPRTIEWLLRSSTSSS